MIERQRDIHLSLAQTQFGWQRIGFQMRPHKAGLSRNRRKTDADLGSAHRFGKSLFRQTRIVAHELTGAIHDHLWRINRSEAEPLAVSGLAIGLRTVYTPQMVVDGASEFV